MTILKKRVEKVRIYNSKSEEMYDYISGNEITTKILENIENVDITLIGGPDVLLEVKGKEDPSRILILLKLLLLC